MYTHKHTRRKIRKHFEKEHDSVRVHKCSVRAVDEDHVVRLKCVEQREIGALKRHANDVIAQRVDIGAGVWIN